MGNGRSSRIGIETKIRGGLVDLLSLWALPETSFRNWVSFDNRGRLLVRPVRSVVNSEGIRADFRSYVAKRCLFNRFRVHVKHEVRGHCLGSLWLALFQEAKARVARQQTSLMSRELRLLGLLPTLLGPVVLLRNRLVNEGVLSVARLL